MRCRRIQQLIDAYLDREGVTEEQQEQIAQHTHTCARCQSYFARQEELASLLRSVPQLETPPRFRPELMRRLRQEEEGNAQPWLPRLLSMPASRFAVVLSMMAALLIFGLFLWRQVTPPQPDERLMLAQALQIDVVSPFEDAVVEPGGIDVAAAFYAPGEVRRSDLKVRLLMDEKDVTDVTEINDEFVIYTADVLDPGPHLATVQLLDEQGLPVQQRSWEFYVLGSSL